MKKVLFIFACLLMVLPALKAADAAEGVTNTSGKTAEEHYLLGKAKADSGKFAAAIKEFDKAVAADPKLDRAFYEKGNSLEKTGKNEDAIAAYNEAKKLNPGEGKYRLAAGKAYRTAKKLKESLVDLDLAIKNNQDYADAWVAKSLTLFDMGNTEAAQWSADEALEIDPGLADAWSAKKDILIATGRHELALPYFDKLAEAYPEKTGLLLEKADAYIRLEKYDNALEAVAAALKIEPKSVEALAKKGGLLHELGYNFEAVDNYNVMLKMKLPNEARVLALQGKAAALRSLEKEDEADKCLKEAEALAAKIQK